MKVSISKTLIITDCLCYLGSVPYIVVVMFILPSSCDHASASLVYDVLRSQNSVYESDLMQYFISVNTMRDPRYAILLMK